MLIQIQLRHQTSDSLLELAVLGGEDERIDAAAGKYQYHTQVIQPASEVDTVAEKVDKEQNCV